MNFLAERMLAADAIIQPDRSLCMGALRHLTEVLLDALYRPLIILFGEMASRMTFDDDRSLQSTIVNAYLAVKRMMSSPFPKSKTTVPLSEETTLNLTYQLECYRTITF
jgi:hypothetical protein